MRIFKLRLAAMLGMLAVGVVMTSGVALADDWAGRAQFHGYFSDVTVQTTKPYTTGCPYSAAGNGSCNGADNGENVVLPTYTPSCGGSPDALPFNCVRTVDELMNLLKRDNNLPANSQDNKRLIASSAFIVQTLLGRDGAQANNNGGRNISNADFADLLARMQAAEAAGEIDWSASAKSPDRSFAVWVNAPNQADVTHYTDNGDPQSGPAIIFCKNKCVEKNNTIPISNTRYILFRACANPSGQLLGLDRVNYTMTPGGFLARSAVSLTGAPINDVLHVTLKHDNETAPSDTGVLQVGVTAPGGATSAFSAPTNALVSPCAPPLGGVPCTPNVNPVNQTNLNGPGSSNRGFRGNPEDAAFPAPAGAPDWWWKTNVFQKNDTASATAGFVIAANAPAGVYKFHVCYDPSDNSGDTKCVTFNLAISASLRSPSVVTTNSDVHAGGGLCDASTLTDGDVIGNGSGASMDQYVVSASGIIGNFGSNNAVSGAARDTLGLDAYAQICRPDLLKTAHNYVASGGTGYGTIGAGQAGNLDVATLTAHSLYYYNAGGTLHLHGVVPQRLTIVDPSGNVVINGDITLPGGNFVRSTVPSLGIITEDNIDILSNVTEADAYFFSSTDSINTCGTAAAPNVPCNVATPVLVVKGFFMAQDILLSRLGPAGSSGVQTAEQISLNPELYLNPPMFFDASVDQTELEGQGERQPLF